MPTAAPVAAKEWLGAAGTQGVRESGGAGQQGAPTRALRVGAGGPLDCGQTPAHRGGLCPGTRATVSTLSPLPVPALPCSPVFVRASHPPEPRPVSAPGNPLGLQDSSRQSSLWTWVDALKSGVVPPPANTRRTPCGCCFRGLSSLRACGWRL